MRRNLIPLIAITTTINTIVSAFPALEARKNVNRPDPANLDHCPGRPKGDADRCTFEKQQDLPDKVIWVIIGDPVANCGNPNAKKLTTNIGGDTSVSETWDHSDSAEIDLFGIKIGGEGGWSETKTQTFSQHMQFDIPPGKQMALTVGVTHKQSQGRIRINYGDPSGDPGKNDYHYIWYQNGIVSSQPTDQNQYDYVEKDCGQNFDRNNPYK